MVKSPTHVHLEVDFPANIPVLELRQLLEKSISKEVLLHRHDPHALKADSCIVTVHLQCNMTVANDR